MKSHQRHQDKVLSFSLEEVRTSGNQEQAEGATEEKVPELAPPSEEEISAMLASLEAESRERGFAEGEQAGRALVLKKLAPLEQSLLEITREMQDLKVRMLKECEADIVAMVLAIARHILGEGVQIAPEALLSHIGKIIRKIGEEAPLSVRLHPLDIEAITKASEALSERLDSGLRFRLEPDSSLLRGDCIVEGRERAIDARAKSQLKRFEAALMEAEGR